MDAVGIVNQALDQIGARTTIQSLNPPMPLGVVAEAAARNYQPRLDSLMRAAPWGCLRFQADLTLLKAAQGTPENGDGSSPQPPIPWRYEYALPTNPVCLRARYVIPQDIGSGTTTPVLVGLGQTTLRVSNAMPFAVAVDTDANGVVVKTLLTNAENAQLVYTARITNPDLWDAQFVDAAVATLAAWLVNPVAGSRELMQERVQMAAALVAQARITDGNEAIGTIDHVPDWIQARGLYFSGAHNPECPWDTLSFPDGTVI